MASTGPFLDSDCHLKFKWTCAGGKAERSHGGPSSTRKQKHKGENKHKEGGGNGVRATSSGHGRSFWDTSLLEFASVLVH